MRSARHDPEPSTMDAKAASRRGERAYVVNSVVFMECSFNDIKLLFLINSLINSSMLIYI